MFNPCATMRLVSCKRPRERIPTWPESPADMADKFSPLVFLKTIALSPIHVFKNSSRPLALLGHSHPPCSGSPFPLFLRGEGFRPATTCGRFRPPAFSRPCARRQGTDRPFTKRQTLPQVASKTLFLSATLADWVPLRATYSACMAGSE